MRGIGPHPPQPWRPVRQRRHLEETIHMILRKPGQLQLDEQKHGTYLGACLTNRLMVAGNV